MRYEVGFVVVLALLAWPLGVAAEGDAVQVQATDAQTQAPAEGVHEDAVTDPPHPTEPDFKVEYVSKDDPYAAAEERVHSARVGMGVSALVIGIAAGASMAVAVATICSDSSDSSCSNNSGAVIAVGTVIGTAGFVGLVASGTVLRKRKKELASLKSAHRRKGRKVTFDPATSRFVF